MSLKSRCDARSGLVPSQHLTGMKAAIVKLDFYDTLYRI
jgi:hypothetical protein